MSTYEGSLGRPAQRISLGHELAALPDRRPRPHCSRSRSRSPQARLSAARPLPPHRFFLRRESGGQGIARLRPRTHLVLHGQPRQPVRPLHPLLRYSAACPRVGARIPFPHPDLWLADEALRQRACAQRAQSQRFEASLAADAGSHPQRRQPYRFSRSQAHPRRLPQRFRRRRLPLSPTTRRPHRPRQPRRFLPPSPHRPLAPPPRHHHRPHARHHRNQRTDKRRHPRTETARPQRHRSAGRSITCPKNITPAIADGCLSIRFDDSPPGYGLPANSVSSGSNTSNPTFRAAFFNWLSDAAKINGPPARLILVSSFNVSRTHSADARWIASAPRRGNLRTRSWTKPRTPTSSSTRVKRKSQSY